MQAGCLNGVRMDWDRDGKDWPLREFSHFIDAPGFRRLFDGEADPPPAAVRQVPSLRWHVQVLGEGPPILLLHGTGASTHSWRDVAPRLVDRFTVIAPDLPGHGFTEMPALRWLSLPRMASHLRQLLLALDVRPVVAVGHSAGAAVLVRMALDGLIAPKAIIGVNAALRPFQGIAGRLFPHMAKLLFLNPFAPRLFAWRAADRQAVARVIGGTGSALGEEGLELYARLFGDQGHVAATLAMMAHWDLASLQHELPGLDCRLALLVGERDRAVPPGDSEQIRSVLHDAEILRLPKLGHLAHEEAPEQVAAIIRRVAEGPD